MNFRIVNLLAIIVLLVSSARYVSCAICKGNKVYEYGLQHREDLKRVILKSHNELRQQISEGKFNGMPKGYNMYEMIWDDGLMVPAQDLANGCVMEHNRVKTCSFPVVGQNLAWAATTDRSVTKISEKDVEDLVKSWIDEWKYFDTSAGLVFNTLKGHQNQDVGHYTQMIWGKSYAVGCGVIAYEETKNNHVFKSILLACNYGPAGNVMSEPIYDTAKSHCQPSEKYRNLRVGYPRTDPKCAKLYGNMSNGSRSANNFLKTIVSNILSITMEKIAQIFHE